MSAGRSLLSLEELLQRDGSLYLKMRGSIMENVVILKDNEIEHRLDESIPYRAITETTANAILVSSLPLFERAEFSGDVYLGVIGNSTRTDTILQYICYLASFT